MGGRWQPRPPRAHKYAYLQPLLASTEVVLLATSGEEAGLRGSKRFVAAHAAEHASLPTAVLALESTHDAQWLSVIDAEPWPGAVHDPALRSVVVAAARQAGLPALKTLTLPLGGTDGSAFTRGGVAAAVLNAVDARSLPPQYHTRRDVLASVQPEALRAQLALVLHTAAAVGRGEWERAGGGGKSAAAQAQSEL